MLALVLRSESLQGRVASECCRHSTVLTADPRDATEGGLPASPPPHLRALAGSRLVPGRASQLGRRGHRGCSLELASGSWSGVRRDDLWFCLLVLFQMNCQQDKIRRVTLKVVLS